MVFTRQHADNSSAALNVRAPAHLMQHVFRLRLIRLLLTKDHSRRGHFDSQNLRANGVYPLCTRLVFQKHIDRSEHSLRIHSDLRRKKMTYTHAAYAKGDYTNAQIHGV